MSGAPVWYKLPAFVLCILPVGIIIGGLTYMSRRVWPAAFLHAAHNNYDQAVFAVITRGDDMMYYVSETGFLTIICAWVIAIIMIIKIKDNAAKGKTEAEKTINGIIIHTDDRRKVNDETEKYTDRR